MSETDWDGFDSEAYFQHNYSSLRAHNERYMHMLCDASSDWAPESRRVLDIGTGSNLFPVISLLPFASRIECSDRSASNRNWLESEFRGDGARWIEYFDVCRSHLRSDVAPFLSWSRLVSLVEVVERDVDDLEVDHEFDIVSSFFVIESSTDRVDVVAKRMKALAEAVSAHGDIFVGLMLGSLGYSVGGVPYPAVALQPEDVREMATAAGLKIESLHALDRGVDAVRSGYTGMAFLHATPLR